MAKRTALLLSSLLLASACGTRGAPERAIVKQGGFTRAPFGHVDGKGVFLYTLTNAHGMGVRAMSYGATIVSVRVPDRDGRSDDVVLGFDSIDGYLAVEPYFGAIVGQYGNRIAKGRFALDGQSGVVFTHTSPDGDEGYPGTLNRVPYGRGPGGR